MNSSERREKRDERREKRDERRDTREERREKTQERREKRETITINMRGSKDASTPRAQGPANGPGILRQRVGRMQMEAESMA